MARRKGGVDLRLNTKRVIRTINDVSAQRMYAATQIVRNEVLETLSGDRTGRRYKVPGTENTYYTASAPGEAPAVATGQLRQRIETSVQRVGRMVIGMVGSPLEKSVYLEHGTRHMQPRRFLRPSFERALPEVKKTLSRRWM